ncbi:winged helix-turn-helix domain-containing protein [Saccharopolyspora spinosporotrichia]
MTDRLEFGLLGPLHLEYRGRRIAVGGPRQRIVLAMLLLNPDRVVSIDRISEAIWNGRPPATARTQVAICVAELRKAFRSAGFRDDVVLTSSPATCSAAPTTSSTCCPSRPGSPKPVPSPPGGVRAGDRGL